MNFTKFAVLVAATAAIAKSGYSLPEFLRLRRCGWSLACRDRMLVRSSRLRWQTGSGNSWKSSPVAVDLCGMNIDKMLVELREEPQQVDQGIIGLGVLLRAGEDDVEDHRNG